MWLDVICWVFASYPRKTTVGKILLAFLSPSRATSKPNWIRSKGEWNRRIDRASENPKVLTIVTNALQETKFLSMNFETFLMKYIWNFQIQFSELFTLEKRDCWIQIGKFSWLTSNVKCTELLAMKKLFTKNRTPGSDDESLHHLLRPFAMTISTNSAKDSQNSKYHQNKVTSSAPTQG